MQVLKVFIMKQKSKEILGFHQRNVTRFLSAENTLRLLKMFFSLLSCTHQFSLVTGRLHLARCHRSPLGGESVGLWSHSREDPAQLGALKVVTEIQIRVVKFNSDVAKNASGEAPYQNIISTKK